MAKPKTKLKTKTKVRILKKPTPETDSTYVLKLVVYLIIGSQWLRIAHGSSEIPIPVGFILGIYFTTKEHFQIDRKIEYAVLLMSVFLGFWLPIGVSVAIR